MKIRRKIKLFSNKNFPLAPVSWTGPRGYARSRILSGSRFSSLCLMYFALICTVSAASLIFHIFWLNCLFVGFLIAHPIAFVVASFSHSYISILGEIICLFIFQGLNYRFIFTWVCFCCFLLISFRLDSYWWLFFLWKHFVSFLFGW